MDISTLIPLLGSIWVSQNLLAPQFMFIYLFEHICYCLIGNNYNCGIFEYNQQHEGHVSVKSASVNTFIQIYMCIYTYIWIWPHLAYIPTTIKWISQLSCNFLHINKINNIFFYYTCSRILFFDFNWRTRNISIN